jgi:DNA-binding CsgD family transcriptional regulator
MLVSGQIALARGDLDSAESRLQDALQGSSSAMVTWRTGARAAAVAGLARVHLMRGAPETALQALLPALDVIAAKGAWVMGADLLPAAVDTLLAMGRLDQARSLVEEFRAGIRGRDAPLARAGLSCALGQLAVADGAQTAAGRAFANAQQGYIALSRPYDAAQCVVRRGLSLPARLSHSDVGALLDALATFQRLGAVGDERRLRQWLRVQHIAIPQNQYRQVPGAALTPREQEVVGLAARGRTATEIGEALALSERTVEQYLRFAKRKLGVRHKRDFVGATAAVL